MTNVSRPSRREALGLGLGAIGVGAVAGGATASAGDPPVPDDGAAGGGDGTNPPVDGPLGRLEATAPTTPGTNYVSYEGFAFQGQFDTANNVGNFGELQSTTSTYFTVHVDVPDKAIINEVVWYHEKFAVSNCTFRLVRIRTATPSPGSWFEIFSRNTSSAPVSAGVVQNLIVVPPAIAPIPPALPELPAVNDTSSFSYLLIANMPNGGSRLNGVRVGFTIPAIAGPQPTSFFPLTPGRVYDSRWAVFGSAKILAGENRQISIKDRRRISPDDGAVDLVDFVPAGAKAIAYNLTATDTVGVGFLAATPGDATTFATSAINWASAGLSIANGSVVSVDAARTIKVFAGGSTHFIIDVVGYYA